MRDRRRPRDLSALRRLLPGLSVALALAALTACGGGGGPVILFDPNAPPVVDGLTGHVSQPDFDIGRIIEQEPNDAVGQAFQLPPIWERSVLEVTGEVGVTAAQFGRVDPVDAFLLTTTENQSISLELTFLDVDPVSAGLNDLGVEVFRRATGVSLATTAPGGQPRTLTFETIAEEEYELVLTAAGGHAWYVIRLVLSDIPMAPLLSQGKPGGARGRAAPLPGIARPTDAAPDTRGLEGRTCAGTHVLVRLRQGCDAQAFCARRGLRLGSTTGGGSHRILFDAPAGSTGEAEAVALCDALAHDADVLWAEPDYVIRTLGAPDDAAFNRQWNMRAVGAPSAWDVTTGDESVVVAVIDTGVTDHPDLVGQTVEGFDFISSPLVAGDGNARDNDPTDEGDQFGASGLSSWHGTHVAALIVGKRNNGLWVSGMAPRCRAMILRALGIGGGFVSDAADAILFAAGLFTTPDGRTLTTPVPVINLSIGLPQDSMELKDACDRASNQGSLLVAAVGNNGGSVLFPARYASTLAVAGVDGKLLTTSYSSFGSTVDIAAPGGGTFVDHWNDGWHDGVPSAIRDETLQPAVPGLGFLVGTSQASPHVAGAAALLKSIDPGITATGMRTVLKGTAFDLGVAGEDVAYGSGLLQVHEAVKLVLESLGTPRGDAPYLMLPSTSMQFEGLRSTLTMPLYNGGGGQLNVFFVAGVTDDGAGWLSAQLLPAGNPGAPVNNRQIRVNIDRALLPPGPGRSSGSVLLANALGTLRTIRVVTYVGERTRAGQFLPVAAIEEATGIARRKGFAFPEYGYRYWFRNLPNGAYRLKSGEDLDGDGFFCESFDACGWHGGPTEVEAVPVTFIGGQPAVTGLTIQLAPPP